MAIIYGMCVMFRAQRSWLAEYCSTQVCPIVEKAIYMLVGWKKNHSWQLANQQGESNKKGKLFQRFADIPRHESNITNYLYSYSKNNYWAFSYMQQPIVWSLFSVCWAKHHKLTQLKQVLRRIQKQWLKQVLFSVLWQKPTCQFC